MKNLELVIAVAVAIAVGILNLIMKVQERMTNKKNKSDATLFLPCAEYKAKIDKNEVRHEQVRKELHELCILVETKLGRLEERLNGFDMRNSEAHDIIMRKLDKINGGV